MSQDIFSCPHCKNPIYDEEALLCHFCGESLQRPTAGLLNQLRYGRRKWMWILLIAGVLAGFLFMILS